MIYISWDIEQNILKLVALSHFLPFNPLKNPKIKILENEKIYWIYHHFTHVYQKSQYMIYGSWDMEWDRHTLSYWAIFCPFTNTPSPPMIPKIKILKKMKKMPGDIILLYIHVYINEDHMIYGSWNIRCWQTEIFVILANYLSF